MSGRWQQTHYRGSRSQPHSNIGPTLRRARLARGLTQSDLAVKLGFPVALIEAIERGQTEDQLPVVMAMSIELDLDLKDLFGAIRSARPEPTTTSRIRLH